MTIAINNEAQKNKIKKKNTVQYIWKCIVSTSRVVNVHCIFFYNLPLNKRLSHILTKKIIFTFNILTSQIIENRF